MYTKQDRMNNLFNNKTKNTIIIPMDHGIMMGVQQGLEDPVKSLKRFVDLHPDGLLINFGILKLTRDYLNDLNTRPGIVVGIDFNQTWEEWKVPIDAKGIIGHCNVTKVKNVAKYGADAVKVLFPLGLGPDLQLDYIRHIGEVINEAEEYEMPVMVEPVVMGDYIEEERKNDPKVIADGCRVALELGADILKVPYPGTEYQDEFREICGNSNVPVIVLGGVKRDEIKEILKTAREGVDAGARGPIFGRNVWQRPIEEMKKVVQSLQEIVHEGAGVEAVMQEYNL